MNPEQNYGIHFISDSFKELQLWLANNQFSQVFVLVDENTNKHCLPLLIPFLNGHVVIQIKKGERNKTLITAQKIWSALQQNKAGRNSLLINLGGGVICDIGGFCASTFKRGIKFINIPTTLLAMVDASIGGKQGVDFNFEKNMIGVFRHPEAIFIYLEFLKSLTSKELKNGYAESLKHALISDNKFWYELSAKNMSSSDIIKRSIQIKQNIVLLDPLEKGQRKILNFGHTIGHAFESCALLSNKKPLSHGYAVSAGMICEAYISNKICNLKNDELLEIENKILKTFPKQDCYNNRNVIIDFMRNDKKNDDQKINFTLLEQIGKAEINLTCDDILILESLSYYESL